MSSTKTMISTPQITQSEALQGAVIHLTISRAKIQAEMDPAIKEVLAAVAASGQSPAAPLYSYHLTTSSENFDFEVGVPVSTPIAPTGRVKMSGLPAARVARTIYRGPYDGLFSAWSEFSEWMKREGHKGTGRLWERYLTAPDTTPDPAN